MSTLQPRHLVAGESEDILALSSQCKLLVLVRLIGQELRQYLAQQRAKLLPQPIGSLAILARNAVIILSTWR